jgi:hypothetical protein
MLLIAAGFVGLALLWWQAAVPALVKYPTDLDVTPRYQGIFTLYVDPTTTAPLATPLQLPLDIERHIRSLEDESGASRAVVEETITQRAGDLVEASQTNVYVMDRRKLQNVADDRAYAFDPANVVDRSGAYRLNLPFGTSSRSTYPIYKNEIGTTYEMRADTKTPDTNVLGLRLRNFSGSATEVPLDKAYLAELNKVVPLPSSTTLDQLKPQLEAAGLHVDAVLARVAPVMAPADLATLAQLAAKPIPLQYVLSFDGDAAVEPTTGAEVAVSATEAIGAKAVVDVAGLQAVLARYSSVPEVAAAGRALAALGSTPATKLFEYRYQQTAASVADIADEVKSMRDQIRLAERSVPIGLLFGTLLSLVVGGGYWLGRRGRTDPPAAAPTAMSIPEPEPVTSGRPR